QHDPRAAVSVGPAVGDAIVVGVDEKDPVEAGRLPDVPDLVVVGARQADAVERILRHLQAIEVVAVGVRQLDAGVELLNGPVPDRDVVEAAGVIDPITGVDAVDRVAAEVDPDVARSDDKAVAGAVRQVVFDVCVVRDHLAARHVLLRFRFMRRRLAGTEDQESSHGEAQQGNARESQCRLRTTIHSYPLLRRRYRNRGSTGAGLVRLRNYPWITRSFVPARSSSSGAATAAGARSSGSPRRTRLRRPTTSRTSSNTGAASPQSVRTPNRSPTATS